VRNHPSRRKHFGSLARLTTVPEIRRTQAVTATPRGGARGDRPTNPQKSSAEMSVTQTDRPRAEDRTTTYPPAPTGLGLSAAQVAGSALAAVSGAFLASWLGVTGTLVGAAVGSVVGTVGSASYTYSLRRGQALMRTPGGGAQPAEGGRPTAAGAKRPRPQVPWRRLGVATVVAAVLGLVGLTVLETVAGGPVSSVVGGSTSSGTTLGHVFGQDDGSTTGDLQDDTGEPASTPSDEPTTDPTAEPTTEPTTDPSADPTPSDPTPLTPDPTTDPTTDPTPGTTEVSP
jgi:hypothetical protein